MDLDLKEALKELEEDRAKDRPSPHGRILFVISDLDAEWSPLVIGFEGYHIEEEVQAIGHTELAELIPMPPDKDGLHAGIYVWEGDVEYRCVGRDYETGIEDYELSLEKGGVRLADLDDLALARNFHIPEPRS